MDEIDPTTKMVGAIKLKEFPGDEYSTHKEAWIPWINHVIGCAVDAGPGARGYIGHVISAAAYTARYPGATEVFKALPEPGPNNNDGLHADRVTAYNRQESFIKLFRNKIKGALDWTSLAAIGTPTETLTMHPKDILTRLEEEYGTYSAMELDEMKEQLKVPIDVPEEWAPLISLHKAVYEVLARNNRPMDEESKITNLQKALTPIGAFKFALDLFESQCPLGHNDRTFFNFCDKMRKAHALITNKKVFSASVLFSNKSILKRTAEDSNPESNNFVRNSTQRSNSYAGAASSSSSSSSSFSDPGTKNDDVRHTELKLECLKEMRAIMAKSKVVSSNHYCWTHGFGNHDSKSCKYQRPGHVEKATAKNQFRGSNHINKKKK
jgi:hypothetical protein